jgi:hypothetical protein
MDSQSFVLPQILDNRKFFNQDGYMDIPIKYRPLRNPSASASQIQSELVSNKLEEWAYRDLNKGGCY